MKTFMFGLMLCVASVGQAGIMVSQPSNLNDYLAVQFVPGEDSPTIKANGLTVTNGNVWVEKSSPVFETEFSGYDYPFVLHDLTAYTSLSGGVIEVGQGNSFREMKYFSSDWVFYPWHTSTQLPAVGVPEPATLGIAGMALIGLGLLSRRHTT